jgi:hypothetical protein
VIKMAEDDVVEIIQYIEGLSKQEKIQIFTYLFDELLKINEDDVLEIEWDWIEDMLPYWCEDVRGIIGMGHN